MMNKVLIVSAASLVIWSWIPATNSQGGDSSPEECRDALGFEIPKGATSVRHPRDEQALAFARSIAGLLDLPLHGFPRGVEVVRDSLKAEYGEQMLRRAMTAILAWDEASFEGKDGVGYFYALFGGDVKIPLAIALNSQATVRQRIWAVDAIAVGTWFGTYADTMAAPALANVVCDMAFVLRPFYERDPVGFTSPAVQDQWVLERANALFKWALVRLRGMDTKRSNRLFRGYVDWEPHPGLGAIATELGRTIHPDHSRRHGGH